MPARRNRPYGFQPGHSLEWAKLLLLIERCSAGRGRADPERGAAGEAAAAAGEAAAATGAAAAATGAAPAWLLETAESLFAVAVDCGWDRAGGGGFCYTFGSDGGVLDRNKYYWALAEGLAAAGLLARRTGKPSYWEFYRECWAYADAHFIDHERGGWYPMLNAANVRVDTHAAADHAGLPVKCYPSKTDYHPLAAC